jgi:hypothetical protein
MIFHYFRTARMLWLMIAAVLPLVIQSESRAALGEDTEKPVPSFTREGKTITAKLIPRAKSTSVLIDFNTAQGNLADVKAIEFDALQTPDVDIKEFKSAFFDVTIDDMPPGSEAVITISSSFFSISTEYWIYNAKKPVKWFNPGIKTEDGADGANQFVIRVVDGGELDSDGLVNGRIQLIGGPKDYFWSYAIGTLLVRLFGIFLVLSMLMIGMLAAGRVFMSLEKKRTRLVAPSSPAAKPAPSPQAEPLKRTQAAPSAPDSDTVAAIATALHLHLAPEKSRKTIDAIKADQNPWVQYGRADIQNARFQTFLRPVNPKNHF